MHTLVQNFRTLEILCLRARDCDLTERTRANIYEYLKHSLWIAFLLRDRANKYLKNHQKIPSISIEQTSILITDNWEINSLQSKNFIDHTN